MLSNTDLTLYRREYDPSTRLDIWEREYIPSAWWFESQASSVDADGMHSADVYTIRIPDISIKLKKEDYLVKGKVDLDMKVPSDLAGFTHCKVIAANYNTFGENPHIKVVGS